MGISTDQGHRPLRHRGPTKRHSSSRGVGARRGAAAAQWRGRAADARRRGARRRARRRALGPAAVRAAAAALSLSPTPHLKLGFGPGPRPTDGSKTARPLRTATGPPQHPWQPSSSLQLSWPHLSCSSLWLCSSCPPQPASFRLQVLSLPQPCFRRPAPRHVLPLLKPLLQAGRQGRTHRRFRRPAPRRRTALARAARLLRPP